MSYTIILRRDRPSKFEGIQEAPRLGKFVAAVSPARFDSLAQLLAGQAFFRESRRSTTYQEFVAPSGSRGDACFDVEKTRVTLRLDGRS
ncbi:MAG TPA: hypothetical protein VL295_10700, partial [Gemmatimonadales bacterium]|nr:hypothetical protein [Gemmatimonadales bacterium]